MFLIWVGVFVGFFLVGNGVLLSFWPKHFVRFYEIWAAGDHVGKARIHRDVERFEYRCLGLAFVIAGLYMIWHLVRVGFHGPH